jgi:putative hydrolase of the HAD superfamily
VDAVLFDLYDTLAWSRWGELSDHVAARLGIDRAALHAAYGATRYRRSIGAYEGPEGDMAAVIAAAGIDPEPGIVKELTDHERRFLGGGGVILHEDVPEVAAEFRARGVKTALISNCSHSTIPLVAGLGLDRMLDVIVLSVQIGAAKPEAAIYRAALERVGVPAADALFVDDQTRYCDGAAALGIDTRLVLRPDAAPIEGVAVQTNGHRVISDLRSLL